MDRPAGHERGLTWADIRGREVVRACAQGRKPSGQPDPGERRELLWHDGGRGSGGRVCRLTCCGGAAGQGMMCVLDAAAAVTVLYSVRGSEGCRPHAGLIQARDGNFYGTTPGGGVSGGTVFKIDAAGILTT